MKQLTKTTLLLLGLMVASIGCDAAKEKMDQAQGAGAGMIDGAKDMANIDFGDFDMKAMKDQLTGVTNGFKDVTAENVDGLTTKITDLSGSIDNMGIGSLEGPAKTFASGVISKFVATVKTAMDGISDEGILAKLKPVVESLMEKLSAFQ